LASEVGVYYRGTSPWPRLSSTAWTAVENRASTADPGVFSSKVPMVPVDSGTLHYRSLASGLTGPASPQMASETASTRAIHCGVLALPLPAWFFTPGGASEAYHLSDPASRLTPGEFLFRSGQTFDLSIFTASALTSWGQYIIGPRWHKAPRLFSTR